MIVTSLELTPDLPAPDRCGTCTRCIDACPTQALIAPYELDSNKCISYLTIEKRGAIPEELREGMGRQVFGCDICQDVCPWNRKAPSSDKPEFQAREGLVNPALAWLAEISEEEFREKFRGSPINAHKRSGLRRNALIAIGNSGDHSLIPVAERVYSRSRPGDFRSRTLGEAATASVMKFRSAEHNSVDRSASRRVGFASLKSSITSTSSTRRHMVPIHALWLPILLSAVIVFVASSIIHMALPIHKSDYRKLPDEAKVLDTFAPPE